MPDQTPQMRRLIRSTLFGTHPAVFRHLKILLTLVISTLLISNNRLSRRENQTGHLRFHNIFNISLQESNYMFDIFFPYSVNLMSRYGYLELFQRVAWTVITRVDCM